MKVQQKNTQPKLIKSPLRYPGGKSRAVKFMSKFILPFDEFREPFFGGGSVSFHYTQAFPDATFYGADVNYDLYCLWQQLKINPQKLVAAVRKVKATPYEKGKDLYHEILDRRNDLLSDFQRAIDFFVLNRITFSGVVDAGGFSNAAFEKRFTDSSVDRLERAVSVIRKINFSQDYKKLLTKKPDKEAVFIYLDPPYYTATKSRLYGKKGSVHTLFDHPQLFEALKNCPYNWLMSYDNSAYVKQMYKGFSMLEWELQYGMNNYKQNKAAKGKELLVANYDLHSLLD